MISVTHLLLFFDNYDTCQIPTRYLPDTCEMKFRTQRIAFWCTVTSVKKYSANNPDIGARGRKIFCWICL